MTVAGFLVIATGYSATFLALSTVAVGAWLLLLWAMPETGIPKQKYFDPETK